MAALPRIGRCILGSSLVAAVLAVGCAGTDEVETGDATKTHLLALSTYSASLGTPIEAFFSNPPPANARMIELVFDGTFTRGDGRTEPVKLVQSTNRSEAGAARWTTFGPFGNPFTPRDPDIGFFKGKVGVRVTAADGTVTEDPKPINVRFDVRPSIVVSELQPTTATCDKPALRLIGGLSYRIKTSTIGFKATNIEYAFRTPSILNDAAGKPNFQTESDGKLRFQTKTLAHAVQNNADVVDGAEAFTLPPVPLDAPNYGAVMAIVAKDEKGKTITSVFGMTAHNPIGIFYDGRFELAQIYPAKPVSSCTPGGQQGREVTYNESQMESRQRMLSVTISKSFMKGAENNWSTSDGKTVSKSITNTDGWSNTRSTANSFSFERNHSDTSGVSFNWSDGETVKGEGKVSFTPFGIGAEVGGGAEKRWDRGRTESSSSTDGWSMGQSSTTTNSNTVDHSTATTDSSSVTTTNTKGGSESTQETEGEALQDAWTVTSQQTIDRGFKANVIANTYGVFYRQMARYTQRAFVVVYNKCGEGDVIGDLTLQDYVWAPDLALGEKCPPLPQSNFPQPQCQLPPCDP
jgi:hypothetical protein